MDLSITPVVLPLLFVGFSYAQELVLNPDTTIVINSRSKGLVINCEVVGMGIGQRANVQWLDTKGNVIGPYSNMRTPRIYSNQMGNRNSLQFVTLVNSDAGRYTCRGTIGSKIMTKQIQLSLNTNGLPSIKVPPTWSTPVVGKRFELTCLADGRPQPSFIFDKDKFVLSGDRYNVSVTKGVNGSQGVLVIEDFHYTDQGNYSCIAYNQVGHESRTVVISTVVPPVIEPILNISEPEGNAAELVCAARGNPSPVVTWKVKDSDIPITDSQDITIEYTHKEDPLMHFITVKLKFARLERNHTNNYTCSASNVGGTDEKEGRIAVEFKPNFADSPYSSAYGWVNHKTEIKCVANAVPPPVLFWEHNNAMVIRGPFFGISSTQENQQTISTLEVLVTVENKNTIFGNYKCVARNYLGSSEKDIILKHAAVPSAPGVSIVAVSPTTISLLVTADMTGGQPIEAYKVMFYAEGDDQNQVSQLVPVNITSQLMPTEFVINNLTPSRRYFISVNARNNLGYGAKAEISAMTRAIRQPSRPKVTSPRSSDDPNSYKLVWEKPGTGGMPLTGYVVKYYQVELSDGHTDQVKAVVGDIKLLQIGQGNVTEIMLTDLIPNSTYELQISAMNAIGKSAAASKIFTTPSEESMPPAPDVSVAAVSPTSISLLMMADMTGGQPIEAYRVIFYAEGDDQNQVSQLVPVNTTSKGKQTRFVINNLIPSRRYVINVDARNNMGYTARTAISTMTQDIRQPNPPKVTSPRSSDDPNSYKLVWEKPGTGGMPLTGYVVKYCQVKLSEDHPGEVKAVVGDIKTISIYRSNVTEITLFGLKPNCTYELQISATNAKGMSMPTNKIFTTPPGGSKPSAPSISADEVTSSSIRLLIAKEQETGGLPIIAYRIVYYAKGNVKGKIRRKIPVNTNSEDVQTVFLIDNLEAGVQYFIRVTARNNLGYGAKARMSVRTPFFTVTSPTSLSFASTFVYFTEGDDESKVTRMTPVKPPSQTSPIRPYNLNVNNVGYWTKDVLRVTTPSVRQPDPPAVTSPRSSDHPNSYKLAWEKPETGGKPLTGYKVKYYQVEVYEDAPDKVKAVVGDKKSLMINQGDTTEMRLPNLEPSSTYELQIIAINEIGESMATKKIFSTPSDRPTNPTVGPTAPSSGTIERKDIECTGATMDIHIPRSLLPTHKVTLRDPTCVVPSNGTHYIISVSFNQCGTTVSFSNDTVVFNNELVATVIQGSNPSTIIDYGLGKDDQRVSLECVYKRHSTVELNYRPLMKAAHFYEKRYGMLDFEVKQYSDEQFTSEITQTNVPTGVVLNREIFIDLIVDQRQANDIGIEVPSCFATPTPSPTDSLYYPLIKSSCPAQTDVRTFTSPNINEFRFSFLAFKFTRAPLQKIDATLPAVPMVYIHCQVSACPRGNCSSSCAQGRRVKRAAIEDSTHLISSGPFYLKTDESSTGYSSIVVGVTMSIAVAATVVAMAAIVAWRRSAAALSAYKSLPMNINS